MMKLLCKGGGFKDGNIRPVNGWSELEGEFYHYLAAVALPRLNGYQNYE